MRDLPFVVLAAALWCGALWLYVLVMAAKSARDRGQLTRFWRLHLAPLVLAALVVDVAFNLVFGPMFLELPREVLFSSRVERHYRGSSGWRLILATFWARNLNVFDPKHITRR